jgi:hypothetical protein
VEIKEAIFLHLDGEARDVGVKARPERTRGALWLPLWDDWLDRRYDTRSWKRYRKHQWRGN